MTGSACLGTLHYVDATAYKAHKALITARFNGVGIKEVNFDPARDGRRPDYMAVNPTGKTPFLETERGCIFTSNAIARFIARCREDTFMYGKTFEHEGQIDSWLDFCSQEVEVPLMMWVSPILGLLEDNPGATKAAEEMLKIAMADLEKQLSASQYLVGDFVSLADIAVVCALREGFEHVFDPSFRQPYPSVCSWFEGCCSLPQFKAVLGEVKFCTQRQQPKAVTGPTGGSKKTDKAAGKKEGPAAPVAAAVGALEAKIKAVADEIRTMKEKLKAEGLSGKQINNHEEVTRLVASLQELRSQPTPSAPEAAGPAAAPTTPAPAAGQDAEAEIKAVGDEIRALKEKLKAEGLSGKKVNEHDQVKALVARLQELKSQAA